MTFEPIYDRLLVERIAAEEKRGSLYVNVGAEREKPHKGRVLAVGHGVIAMDGKLKPLKVQAGDIVYFGKFSGDEIELEVEDELGNKSVQTRLILREADVFGILKD